MSQRKHYFSPYEVKIKCINSLSCPVQIESVCVSVCVCVCVVVIPFILDARLVDVPAKVTTEEGHTGFLHRPSAVLASFFLARRIQSSLSLVDREVEFFTPTK